MLDLNTALEVASESEAVDTVAHADKRSEVASKDALENEKNESVKMTSDDAEHFEECDPVSTVYTR